MCPEVILLILPLIRHFALVFEFALLRLTLP